MLAAVKERIMSLAIDSLKRLWVLKENIGK